ncbi:FecCD family ABC transporter permease [Maridesulfovibrio salexigens]|uniref:Transport system permease protein n=1 Tax=Maridesulfovibrio salexigens (strain ATCC 14822 / DSM 2638 / NCIMB 8403 / VKM B-1763) TaxID=526222 RepID=C6BV08_MARSD|nr:iron ABC transporter permease [Maridesulfovibrio salexigens]ACS78145.1 transport system permease protein [Maridesulfovibrio salexigens DSM 2638]
MHFDDGQIPAEYSRHIRQKSFFIAAGLLLAGAMLVTSIGMGPVSISAPETLLTLLGDTVSKRFDLIIWNIRLPQALTALAAGAGLSVAGAVMQAILRNPLGSPFTLGISHAAAFGAAVSVMLLDLGTMTSSNVGAVNINSPYLTTMVAFGFSLIATFAIIAISRTRRATPEVMVLTGVALGALFTAGTMFLQYFADDVQLAAMVFWTFGDVARATWTELGIISAVTVIAYIWFTANRWNFNAIEAGDETAKGLGVKVERVRLTGMLLSSLVTAVIVSFLGIIGFVGLVCPHMVRRLIGDDYRFLLPASCIVGAVLLLAADTAARLMLAPNVLPVSVLTAFLGAPVFIWLIIRGSK